MLGVDETDDLPSETVPSPVDQAKQFLISQAPLNVAKLAWLRDKAKLHQIKIRSIETMLRHTPGMTETDEARSQSIFNVNILVAALTGERPRQISSIPTDKEKIE